MPPNNLKTGVRPLLIGCAVVGLAMCVVAAGAVIAWRSSQGPAGPFAGGGTYHVLLRADRDPVADDAAVLVERLEALGVSVTVLDSSGDRLELELEGVGDLNGAIAAVTPRHELAFRLVCESQAAVGRLPENAVMGVDFELMFGQEVAVARDPAALTPILARAAHVQGCFGVMECGPDSSGRERCFPLMVESETVLTNEHVASAEAQIDEYDGRPVIMIQMTSEGATRFADATERAMGRADRRLAIIVDGRGLSSPVVQERIGGGAAKITTGSMRPIDEQLQEAHALAAGIARRSLEATWTFESMY